MDFDFDPRPAHCEGDDHDDSYCCGCGHYHQGECPESPCGDHRCCIN
jgi:hypothetical protein